MGEQRAGQQIKLAWLKCSLGVLVAATLAACAATGGEGPPSPHNVWAVTADQQLIRFNAGQPGRVLERRAVNGLAAGERVVGIDYRVSRGVLYAVSSAGRVYTLDPASGNARAVSNATTTLVGQVWGVNFNPVADRIRVVSNTGQNLRLHPETGELVDFEPVRTGVQPDPDLAYAPGDAQAGKAPQVVAPAYTYNKKDDKLTTNFAIDRATGMLVTQGSREGVTPVVSPNTGRLFTVGSLGLGPLNNVAFDIADVDNTGLTAVTTPAEPRTVLYTVDLNTGKASRVGPVGDGAPLVGLAIEP